MLAVGLTRSREAAKGNAEVGVWCLFSRAADGSSSAGSFRSSGFPARDPSSATGCLQIAAAGRRVCVPWASREAAKGNAEVGVWCLFSRAADGSSWVDSFRSSGFPARDPSSATGCLQIAAARRGFCVPLASRKDRMGRCVMRAGFAWERGLLANS